MKILCAIDGSRYSRCAFQALPYLKIGADSSVTLLHVVNTDQLKINKRMSPDANQAIAKALAMAEGGGHTLLTRFEKAAPAQWGGVQSQVVKGSPAAAITRLLVDRAAI